MFLCFTQKFKMAAKSGGKTILQKVASTVSKYPVGQKFCRNHSILFCFRDKRVLAFNTEIQDGCQKWLENIVLKKVTSSLCRYPVGKIACRNHNISLRFLDKRFFAFYAEIQDGHQKWRENDCWKKLLVDSADTLWVKNFVEIALSCYVSEINTILQIH